MQAFRDACPQSLGMEAPWCWDNRILGTFVCRHCRQSQAMIQPSARESVRSVVGDYRHPVVQVVEMVWRSYVSGVVEEEGTFREWVGSKRYPVPCSLLLDNRRIT